MGKRSTFGCELEFVSLSTQTILADPIWDTLQECNSFSLVVRQCSIKAEHKGQLRRKAKVICVPAEDNDRVLGMYRWNQASTQLERQLGKVVSDSKSSNYRTRLFVSRMVPSKDAMSSGWF